MNEEYDPLLLKIIHLLKGTKTTSIRIIMRTLDLSFVRTFAIFEQLEKLGAIGPEKEDTEEREVYI
jgi:DNA segregation ATPase FtsK/SpoIIIE-like protein